VDFSKLKLEAYDFLGIILPGFIAICEGWILLKGWSHFVVSINHLSGTGFTVLAIFAFAIGHLVQEFGDASIKFCKGKRFFQRGRDSFWATEEAGPVKEAIEAQLKKKITVDSAFDYCLTKLKGNFAKRDLFVATSDLCRSLTVLSILAIIPAVRATWSYWGFGCQFYIALAIELAFFIFLSLLSWRRMVRFRYLSEVTVFRAYLATVNESQRESIP
jgi:hypothetical protein